MKTQNVALWSSMILVTLLVSNCMQSTQSLVTPSPTTPILLTSTTTSAPSFTSLPTASAISTLTPAAIPTLPTDEARAELLKMLSDNGGCQLPCLWGIMPGKSSFQEARTILLPISSLAFWVYLDSPGSGGIVPRYTEGDLEIYTKIALVTEPDNNIIDRVAFNAEAHRPIAQGGYEDVFDSKFFGDKVRAYALSHVLAEQGAPSTVMIATFGGPLTRGEPGGFDLLLLYPDRGILVNYTTQMHLAGTNVRACFANAHVEIELFASGQSDSFFEMLKQTDWAVKLNYYKPLEEATPMSEQDFYEMFRDSNNACIETARRLWPTPEP